MRKKFVQIAAFALALILLPVFPAAALPEEESETMIRVGLYYGSSALPGANLQNDEGSGYRFGYMDGDAFCQIGFTEETKISMVKTQNVYYSSSLPDGGYGYSDQITSDLVVGCYHLCLSQTYDTFDEAWAEAEAVGGFPAWIQGEYQVRIGAYTTKAEAEEAAWAWDDVTVVGTSSYGITVVTTGTDRPIFQFDGDNYNSTILVVKPGLDDWEKTVTYFKSKTYYGSFCYERIGGGDLTVVNLVSLEDYVRGILPYEMSNAWPLEALKAQAVCARSYTMTNINRHSAYHFDICNTTHCQVYYGTGSANATTDRAVDETIGEYAWYGGEICQTYYHSCDGGATENSENVWRDELPYLRGASDPFESLVEDEIPGYRWSKSYTGKELQAMMLASGYTTCGEVADVRVTKTTPTGNVYSVTVTDVNGTNFTVSKDSVRTVFGVSSLRYTISGSSGGEIGEYFVAGGGTLDSMSGAWSIDEDGNLTRIKAGSVYAVTGDGTQAVAAVSAGSDGTFVFSGTGKGHNVGMSQWGAYAMALEGYTYEEILHFYFTGIEIG